jgi:hypothetical protein
MLYVYVSERLAGQCWNQAVTASPLIDGGGDARTRSPRLVQKMEQTRTHTKTG